MFDIEVRYQKEKSWHYYGTVPTRKEADTWLADLRLNLPGRTAEFRLRQDHNGE